ncbi:MAG: hypothetical protein RLZZ245_3784 [Verrucomicrobiota bacterium]
MSLWVTYLVSAFGASVLGSLVLWILIGIHPTSTAGFTLSLYVSMLILSAIVITICSSVLLFAMKPLALKLSQMPTAATVGITALVGGLSYFVINFSIMLLSNDKGIVGKFFGTGGFIYPLVIGLIYGCAFGLVYSKVRS